MKTSEALNQFYDYLEDHIDFLKDQRKRINEEKSFQELVKFLNEQQKKLIDLIEIDYEYVTDIEFDKINHSDAPDYCDAYICAACYHDIEMCEELLDKLNEDRDFVYDKLINYLY